MAQQQAGQQQQQHTISVSRCHLTLRGSAQGCCLEQTQAGGRCKQGSSRIMCLLMYTPHQPARWLFLSGIHPSGTSHKSAPDSQHGTSLGALLSQSDLLGHYRGRVPRIA
jgi:hypothetical protein